MKNVILALCFLALLAGGGYYFTKANGENSATNTVSSQPAAKSTIDEKPTITLNKPVEQPAPVAQKPAEEPKQPAQPEQPNAQNVAPQDKANEQPATNQPSANEQPANAEQVAPQNQAEATQNAPVAEPKADETPKEEPKADETPKEDLKVANGNDGIEIDPSGIRINFLSYKMPNKIKVPETGIPATFKAVEIDFAATSGSVAKILTNSTAKIDLNSIDTNKNAIRDNNVKNKFFAQLSSQEVTAKIVSVSGNNEAGDISLSLNLNGIEKPVALKYEVKDGKLTATGEIDLVEGNLFNTKEAFEKFASEPVIQGLHGKKSWSDVQIGFEVPVK